MLEDNQEYTAKYTFQPHKIENKSLIVKLTLDNIKETNVNFIDFTSLQLLKLINPPYQFNYDIIAFSYIHSLSIINEEYIPLAIKTTPTTFTFLIKLLILQGNFIIENINRLVSQCPFLEQLIIFDTYKTIQKEFLIINPKVKVLIK